MVCAASRGGYVPVVPLEPVGDGEPILWWGQRFFSLSALLGAPKHSGDIERERWRRSAVHWLVRHLADKRGRVAGSTPVAATNGTGGVGVMGAAYAADQA